MFKGYKRRIELDFNYDQVKEGVPNVKKQMAILNAEFKATSAAAMASGKEIDKLGTRYDYLGNRVKILQSEVDNHRKNLEKAREAHGSNSKAVENHTASLRIAEAKLAQTKSQLEQVSNELDKQRTVLGKTSKEWEALSSKAQNIGKSLTTRLTLPILGAAAASFKLGADLEDAIGKTNAVFKENSEVIDAWASEAYENFGLARSTALDMANSFGALASGMGVNATKTLEYSKVLSQLAVDMVAFHGGRLEVAETALNSIFTGETESLKKYGIVMTEANLQQFAYTQGIKEKVSSMTEAEKVQLRYNFVMDRSRDVIGHYNKEQDNATTQILKFKEGLKTLGESFSQEVLPMLLPIVEFANGLIEKFSGLSDGTKKFIVIVGGVMAMLGPVAMALAGMMKIISGLSEGVKAVSGMLGLASKAGSALSTALSSTQFFGFVKWAAIIAGVALAIAAVITALNFLLGKGDQMLNFTKNIDGMFSGIGSSINDITNQGKAVTYPYVNGSHRMGLDYVPFDGYVAELHKGERVVPADQNTGYGDTYNLNVRMSEVDEVHKLVKVFEDFKSAKRAGRVMG